MEYTYRHGDRPLPGYTIKRAVGRGAFGEVYFAVSDGGREVALKRLGENAEIELRGVRHCINIKSPHLVSVFDIVTGSDGRPYIVMEFVAGSSPSLRHVLGEHPEGLGEERARFFFHGIASALACLHAQSIVHRDLKPENIFLDADYVKLGDYGLAKHINVSDAGKQTMNLGTVHYMAPEIATGVYDHRVDIYALGVILYEMLTGRAPFMGKDIYEIALKHVASRPETGDLPAPFDRVVARAMAKDPKERYETVHDMAADLDIAIADSPGAVPGHGPTPTPARPAPAGAEKRRRFTVFSGEGWTGRLAMASVAAMALSLAVSVVPEQMGRPNYGGEAGPMALERGAVPEAMGHWTGLIGPEFLPLFCIIAAGTLFTGSAGLWFYRRMRHQRAASMACRLLVSAAISLLCLLVFWCGPFVWLSDQLVLHVGFGLARFVPAHTRELLLFVCFASLFFVNWFGAASPERPARVSLTQACIAAAVAWVICMLTDFGGFMPVSGAVAGLTLCVNFLAPMAEDLGIVTDVMRRRAETARRRSSGLGTPAPRPPLEVSPVRNAWHEGAWFFIRLLFWVGTLFLLIVVLRGGCKPPL